MSFLKHGIQTGFTAIVIQVFSLSIGVINARVLGANAIGILVLLLLLKNLSFTFLQFGFGTSLKYFVAKKIITKKQAVIYTIFFGSLSSLFIICIVVLFWNSKFSIWKDIDKIYIQVYLEMQLMTNIVYSKIYKQSLQPQ